MRLYESVFGQRLWAKFVVQGSNRSSKKVFTQNLQSSSPKDLEKTSGNRIYTVFTCAIDSLQGKKQPKRCQFSLRTNLCQKVAQQLSL